MTIVLVHNWGLLLRVLVAVLFGILAFVRPALTLSVMALRFGAYALVDGVFAIITALKALAGYERWWVLLVEGVVVVIAGVMTFFWPGLSALTLLYYIAAWAITTGAFEVVAAIRFDHVFSEAQPVTLGGRLPIRVIPPVVLMLLKIVAFLDDQTRRAKDLSDIRALLSR